MANTIQKDNQDEFSAILEQALNAVTLSEVEKLGTILSHKKTEYEKVLHDADSEGGEWREAYLYLYNNKRYIIIYQHTNFPFERKECIKFQELPDHHTDPLQEALENKFYTLAFPSEENPKFIIFGKTEISSSYEKGKEIKDMRYNISQRHENDDFSIHYIHDYKTVKEFINKNFGITYAELIEQYFPKNQEKQTYE